MVDVGGFASGFQGGLNQGMGIIRNARNDVAAREKAAFDRQMALKQDDRSERQLGIQETDLGMRAEKHQWDVNDRPLDLGTKIANFEKSVEEALQAKTKTKSEQMMLDNLPVEISLDNASKRANINQSQASAARAWNGIGLDNRQDARAAGSYRMAAEKHGAEMQDHYAKQASQVMPYAAAIIAKGGEVPKQMLDILKRAPTGLGTLIEQANASARFPQVLQRVGKGDMSWMNNAEDRVAMQALAHTAGQASARRRGLDMASARVTGFKPGPGGKIVLNVTAFDPKQRRLVRFEQAADGQKLLGVMQQQAASGAALRHSKDWGKISGSFSKLARSFGGNEAATAAANDYDKQYAQATHTIKLATETSNAVPKEALANAQTFMTDYGNNREKYVQDYTGTAMLAQSMRSPDANPNDYNAVFATVAKYRGSLNSERNFEAANRSLAVVDKLEPHIEKDPALRKYANGKYSLDTLSGRVAIAHEIFRDAAAQKAALRYINQR